MNTCLVLLGLAVGCLTPAEPTVTLTPPPEEPADRWLAEDKARHFALSFAATTFAYGAGRFVLRPETARLAAGAAALVLGVGKEVVDVRRGTYFSAKDLAWDAAGVALGLTLANQIR